MDKMCAIQIMNKGADTYGRTYKNVHKIYGRFSE